MTALSPKQNNMQWLFTDRDKLLKEKLIYDFLKLYKTDIEKINNVANK